MPPRTVLALEQALALPYATLRFVQLGWRVIRIEATPAGDGLPGDPNRYVGAKVADDDRRSYFVAPNVGKEAIALNLKEAEGRAILHRLVQRLRPDVFCCNTLPARYAALGIDYATLSALKPDLIWAGISAMGPDYPDVPGYDPAIQAMAGYMELTGPADGPPTLAGVPLVDLKAGDELYAAVCLALADRAETGKGRAIHVSMLQAATSWLITTLPLLDFDADPAEVTRCGNEHRKFVPTNAYPTADGFIYLAIGNDSQWKRLTQIDGFAALARPEHATNEGRGRNRAALYRGMAEATRRKTTAKLARLMAGAGIPHAPIHRLAEVRELEAVRRKLTRTRTPDGRSIRLQPPGTDTGGPTDFAFPPKYGQHTAAVLREAGYTDPDLNHFRAAGLIAG